MAAPQVLDAEALASIADGVAEAAQRDDVDPNEIRERVGDVIAVTDFVVSSAAHMMRTALEKKTSPKTEIGTRRKYGARKPLQISEFEVNPKGVSDVMVKFKPQIEIASSLANVGRIAKRKLDSYDDEEATEEIAAASKKATTHQVGGDYVHFDTLRELARKPFMQTEVSFAAFIHDVTEIGNGPVMRVSKFAPSTSLVVIALLPTTAEHASNMRKNMLPFGAKMKSPELVTAQDATCNHAYLHLGVAAIAQQTATFTALADSEGTLSLVDVHNRASVEEDFEGQGDTDGMSSTTELSTEEKKMPPAALPTLVKARLHDDVRRAIEEGTRIDSDVLVDGNSGATAIVLEYTSVNVSEQSEDPHGNTPLISMEDREHHEWVLYNHAYISLDDAKDVHLFGVRPSVLDVIGLTSSALAKEGATAFNQQKVRDTMLATAGDEGVDRGQLSAEIMVDAVKMCLERSSLLVPWTKTTRIVIDGSSTWPTEAESAAAAAAAAAGNPKDKETLVVRIPDFAIFEKHASPDAEDSGAAAQ